MSFHPDGDDDSWRTWSTGIGTLRLAAGQTASLNIQPQVLFRVEKVFITDQSDGGLAPGYASFVTGIQVGQGNQLPNNTQMPTWAFGPGLFGNGVQWDACPGAYTMTLTFTAIVACTITGALFGQCKRL